MAIFGFTKIPVRVTCEARLNFSNTDVMMVLDTTGSMNETNPSDSETRLTILKSVVPNYVAMMEGLIARMRSEIGRPAKVIATGGLSVLFNEASEIFDAVDSDLTLDGLAILAERALIK